MISVATLSECTHPSLEPTPPLCSPQTLGRMGAVCSARRRGRPGLKLQEKVGWDAPPRAGVTISSDWSVKSPVSGCLLVSSFTETPMVEEGEGKVSQGVRERDQKSSRRRDLETHLCRQVSEVYHPSAS